MSSKYRRASRPGRAHGKTLRIPTQTQQVIPLSPTHHVIWKPQGQLLRRAEEKIWRILSQFQQVIPLSLSHGVISVGDMWMKILRILSRTQQVIPLSLSHGVISVGDMWMKILCILSRTQQVIPWSPSHPIITKSWCHLNTTGPSDRSRRWCLTYPLTNSTSHPIITNSTSRLNITGPVARADREERRCHVSSHELNESSHYHKLNESS